MRTLLLSLLVLAGCPAPDLAPGFASACLYGAIPEDLYETGGATFEIDGTVVSDEAGTPPASAFECYGTRTRLLTLEDGEGQSWVLSYGLSDPDEQDDTPALDVVAGQAVHLLYRVVAEFGTAQGFVLQDDDGLVAALESGTWGPALQDGDAPGLAVADGALGGTVESECGTEGHYEWVFTGDEALTLQPYASGVLPIGGVDLTAFAVANMQWQGDIQCTDTADDQHWAVFR